MRMLCVVFIFMSIATMAVAKEVFTDKDLKALRVIEIREGKVVIEDSGKNKEEVGISDSIGKERGKVVEIEKGAIVIEQGTTRARLPLFPGVVREINLSR